MRLPYIWGNDRHRETRRYMRDDGRVNWRCRRHYNAPVPARTQNRDRRRCRTAESAQIHPCQASALAAHTTGVRSTSRTKLFADSVFLAIFANAVDGHDRAEKDLDEYRVVLSVGRDCTLAGEEMDNSEAGREKAARDKKPEKQCIYFH